jgi:pimeloyl-ACP methyl ester carboxylesterase
MTTTHMLETAEGGIVYDVDGPLPTANGRPPLFMIGQPMCASGFATLAPHFPDRTVVTYDPRGLGRSTRKDGRVGAEFGYPGQAEAFARKLRDVLGDGN